jgi:hypothetical protein
VQARALDVLHRRARVGLQLQRPALVKVLNEQPKSGYFCDGSAFSRSMNRSEPSRYAPQVSPRGAKLKQEQIAPFAVRATSVPPP